MWNPLSFLKKPKVPIQEFPIQELPFQRNFSVKQENGIAVEVQEIQQMDGLEFEKYIKGVYPNMKIGFTAPAVNYIFNEALEILKDGIYFEDGILITEGMNPCSFVAAVTKKGVFLHHSMTLTRTSPNVRLAYVLKKSFPNIDANEQLELFYGPGKGTNSFRADKIRDIFLKALEKFTFVRKIMQISPPSESDNDPGVHVAVIPQKSGLAKIIISRKFVDSFNPSF